MSIRGGGGAWSGAAAAGGRSTAADRGATAEGGGLARLRVAEWAYRGARPRWSMAASSPACGWDRRDACGAVGKAELNGALTVR